MDLSSLKKCKHIIILWETWCEVMYWFHLVQDRDE
jgi:hypothetical protein